jgi:hypothetical protein
MHWHVRRYVFVVGGLFLAGCGSGPPREEVDNSRANLLGIHSAYSDYISAMRKPPRSLQDLEKTLEDDRGALEHRFHSPHDGKPYVVFWGIMIGANQPSPPVVLAHEQDGVDGNRWVIFTDATCKRMTQAEFDNTKKPAR